MSEGEKQWFFKEQDFVPRGAATSQQQSVLGLEARYVGPFEIEVKSSNKEDVWYVVRHNLVEVKSCECIGGTYNRRCKHKIRVEVVLLRRLTRRYEEDAERIQQERREKSALNTGNPFKLER